MNKSKNDKNRGIWEKIIEEYTRLRDMATSIANFSEDFAIESTFFQLTLDYYHSYYDAFEKKIPIVLCNPGIPVEFLYSANLFPLILEMYSIPISVAGKNHYDYIDFAENSGIMPWLCNNQKTWIGAMLKGETPKPDMLIHADFPCDSTTIEMQIIKKYYNVPAFTFDVPYWHHEKNSIYYDERTVPYYVSQFRNMIKFIEKNTKSKFSFEKLKDTCKITNEARYHVIDILELLQHKPNPLSSDTSYAVYSTMMTHAGVPGKQIEYLKMLKDKGMQLVKNKTGHILQRYGKEEKYRCFWIAMPIYFDPLIFTWMEEKFQISTVMNMMGNQTLVPVDLTSEETILSDFSKNVLNLPMGRQLRGPLEYLLDDIVSAVDDYQADFCIWGGHLGCKHSWGIANLVKRYVQEETGVPVLLFEVDDIDNRLVSSKIIKKNIKNFVQNVIQ
ncbi:MAG: 2-hydroxyacyl-CoA dehydratase [Candidatus Lokiarchaeota archaeon]|nr:2-hydroxyacyl-CoA dehydratase [Candidatus Lokiarchaeota archaeon]